MNRDTLPKMGRPTVSPETIGVLPMNLPTKTAFLVLLCVLISAVTVAAETRYVSEDFEITMRTGPGTDRKIIALVPSGREVEVITAGEEWSEVRLPNGKEGWVLSRYLTETIPTALKLERLENKYTSVVDQNKALQQKLSETASDNKNLSNELQNTQSSLNKVESTFENLKNESADFIKFKATYDKNQKELVQMREKADRLEKEVNVLVNNQLTEGFLYGGGLVIIGFIAGYVLKKPKRRSGLL